VFQSLGSARGFAEDAGTVFIMDVTGSTRFGLRPDGGMALRVCGMFLHWDGEQGVDIIPKKEYIPYME
jgi:hypothetical protein